MNKNQLRDMRAILASEANGRPFPKFSNAVLIELERHKWVENAGGVYKSTQAGRQAVLAAGQKR